MRCDRLIQLDIGDRAGEAAVRTVMTPHVQEQIEKGEESITNRR